MAEVRKRRGLEQKDLAAELEAIGYPDLADTTKISKIESGKRGLSLNEAFAIAAALDVPPVLLFASREDDNALVEITSAPFLGVTTEEPQLRLLGGSLPALVFRGWVRGAIVSLRSTPSNPRPMMDALAEFPDEELASFWDKRAAGSSPLAMAAGGWAEHRENLVWEIKVGQYQQRGLADLTPEQRLAEDIEGRYEANLPKTKEDDSDG